MARQVPCDLEFLTAFYGDVLFEETEAWGVYDPSTLRMMSLDSPDEDYVRDEIAALYIEFQKKYKITNEQVSNELDPQEKSQNHERMAAGIHKRWLKAIASSLERILPSKGKHVAKIFLRQAAAYLHKPGLKEKIDDIVREQIFDNLKKDEDIIILSHSLGTIVSYSLISRLRHLCKIKLFITFGSPLGIEIVKRRLGPPLICPPNVYEWVNVSDEEDFVALQSKLNGETFGCDKIKNITTIDNGEEDAHDILKYLSHTIVAQEILDKL